MGQLAMWRTGVRSWKELFQKPEWMYLPCLRVLALNTQEKSN
jgi:hypothetical protein